MPMCGSLALLLLFLKEIFKMRLRALEPDDLLFLYLLENQEEIWEMSDTQVPFSKHLLEAYLENARQDIYTAKQFRYVIELQGEALGCLDIYDFSPKHRRACVGIAILPQYQGKGYGSQALALLLQHAVRYWDLHQLIAYIPVDNLRSLRLFEKAGFSRSGLQKDWLYWQGAFKDVAVYQRRLDDEAI